MKKRFLLLIILFTTVAFSNELIHIDNFEIQMFRGKIGKWLFIDSPGNFNYYSKKFGISKSKIISSSSKNLVSGYYYFFPYSEKYLQELRLKSGQRRTVASVKNNFIWPIYDFSEITSSFGARLGELHEGIDMPSNKGTPIVAAMDGRVIFSAYAGGHGNSIYIEHRDNYFTRYSHNSVMFVSKGDYVKKGQVIAFVGSTGNSTGNHLHFEIRYFDIPLNPLDFLPKRSNLINEE